VAEFEGVDDEGTFLTLLILGVVDVDLFVDCGRDAK
jgi:hypothetical protein